MFDVYVLEDALQKAEDHFRNASALGLEAMGLFCGSAHSCQGRLYSVLEQYLTAENDATPVSVRFSKDAFSVLSASLSRGRRLLAWAHSHPGYGCFLSFTDVNTQRAYFPEPYHAALVVDPVRNERKFFRLDGDGYRELSYAVIRRRLPP